MSTIGLAGPVPPEVPDPPTAVVAVAGPGLAVVAWSAPAWDGGAAVTTYVSVYAGSIPVQVVRFSGFPAAERVIVPGLGNGISYRFYVSATNRAGTGPQSLPSQGVIPNPPLLMA